MLGQLSRTQIEDVLHTEMVGRLGCHAEGKTYIVPINYVYDDENMYGHSLEGRQIQFLQAHPEVCFEVDHRQNLSHWRSVIAWGTFEALEGEEAARVAFLIMQREMTLIASGHSVHRMNRINPQSTSLVSKIYRIHLVEKTGRFETDNEVEQQ